jgi:hypothetical protein
MTDLDELIVSLDAYQAAHPWRQRFWHVWRTVKHAPGNARNQVRWAWQRVHRGWDDRALWSLDTWLAGTLGAQLVAMADVAHGWPIPSGEFEWTFESWTEALRVHGEGLLTYAEHDDTLPPRSFDPTEVAQADLHWVADHLPNLWD